MECEVSKDLLRSSRPIMLFELHMQLELYAICWALDLERWEVVGDRSLSEKSEFNPQRG